MASGCKVEECEVKLAVGKIFCGLLSGLHLGPCSIFPHEVDTRGGCPSKLCNGAVSFLPVPLPHLCCIYHGCASN